jgi:hypothetical protein
MRRWMQVAHTYNPSYSGGRDQKDQGSKPALAQKKKKNHTKKKGLVEWLKVLALSSNPSTGKKIIIIKMRKLRFKDIK